MILRSKDDIIKHLRSQGVILGDEQSGFKVNPYLEMPKSLAFSDVALFQGMNKCASRLDANTHSIFIRGLKLEVPLIASNMSAVVNADFCIKLWKLGAFGILHRAWADEADYLKEVSKVARECALVGASIGVGIGQDNLTTKLVSAGANVIVIDIAQGFSEPVISAAQRIKIKFPHVKVVVGNTVNPEMMYLVNDFADAVKVGIAQGSACETKNTAGCTVKQYSAIDSFRDVSRKLGLPIISDGSIKEPADFTKAMAAGAGSVMAGSIFARCPESAAELVHTDDGPKKVYFGMASREAQTKWRGGLKPGTCPEGKSVLLPLGESVENLIERYHGALRSGMTYVGATSVAEFQELAKFVRL